jgi:hypothetical protein
VDGWLGRLCSLAILLAGGVTETVVNGKIGGLQVDLVNQFTPFATVVLM